MTNEEIYQKDKDYYMPVFARYSNGNFHMGKAHMYMTQTARNILII